MNHSIFGSSLIQTFLLFWDIAAGTCVGGLEGVPCAFCGDGKAWTGTKCVECGASALGWVVGLGALFIASTVAYAFVNRPVAWLGLSAYSWLWRWWPRIRLI